MLFDSYEFLIFFTGVTAVFFAVTAKWKWLVLLSASCLFYMFYRPEYILVMAFIVLVDYLAGILMSNSSGRVRRFYLICSIAANVGLLAFFKYYANLYDGFTGICHLWGCRNYLPVINLMLPIGLSFHTFQAMSYTIEVYRGAIKPEKHLGLYALYVMFYPQLVAGPVERPEHFLPQLHANRYFNYEDVVQGLRLMLQGFFKKVVLADRLALFTDTVYRAPAEQSPAAVVTAVFLFAFQIYYDFSGYNDIALGAARVMGYRLIDNFNYPFISKSVSEFWHRWHISLSTWFRDYLFLPVVKTLRYQGKFAVIFGLFFTFFLGGIWHKASWNFMMFSVLEGTVIVFELVSKPLGKTLSKVLGSALYNFCCWLTTMIFLMLSWVFFRAANMQDAWMILKKVALFFTTNHNSLILNIISNETLTKASEFTGSGLVNPLYSGGDMLLLILMVLLVQSVSYLERNYALKAKMEKSPFFVRWILYYSILYTIGAWGVFNGRQFIYFQY